MDPRTSLPFVAVGTALLSLLQAPAASAQRASANYAIVGDTADLGGAASSSASYRQAGSVGGPGGRTAAANATVVRAGYLGQLFEVTGLSLSAPAAHVAEGATLPLAARQALDDDTFLAVPAQAVAWSVESGPIVSISLSGLATAALVPQDLLAQVRGTYAGRSSLLDLQVLDTLPDNFGTYAGDGIDDSWQVQYFGLPPNPLAGPGVDASGTGQTNLFKFIAGLDPLDPHARFTLRVESVPGQPTRKVLSFAPIVAGRTYVVTAKAALSSGPFVPIAVSSPVDAGAQRSQSDDDASGPAKFYRVEISR